MSEGIVSTGDNCRIAYHIDGPDGAPFLILSNSLGTAMAMWEAQMSHFAAHFRVVRYDSRGHGRSDAPAGSYSIDRLGRDVIELADALGIDRFHFCGLSKGGMVGQWLGWRAPERLERLVLANTSAYMGPPAGWDERIRLVLAAGMGAMTDAVLERWFTPAFNAEASAALDAVRMMLLATEPQGYAGCCAAIRDMDQRPLLPLIDVPTLVIAGDADPATPIEHAHLLATGIRGATLHILTAAHLSNVEQPEAFSKAVLDFCGVGMVL
ncbi:MAG: 3-oxoadipate enol-lactonase [Sphingobium sp.]|uniref:3-oxoadipate enol-lactonase n=1 Tax=Sphingobium sp. CECT 9361 TaxID=2845384 RepID=UPI001E3CBAB0|nr:3-oxoadipate enol-lactonase [Sphingobium sp. CECT 9361]CAH0352744.1 3-oxoadipate enol-lactonase 2 [Sphingobium sp. CECT 9361]|tara:strand:- start:6890 stop:7690 length:801 start_codon:yes stop_codon:yes gene_type:complete